MKELAGSPIDDNSYELMVLQGLRALLGEDKAQRAMVAMQNSNPAASEQVMVEVQARYDALSPEQKEDPRKTLEQVAASIVQLKFKMVGKAAPKGIVMAIPRFLKSLIVKQ